MSHGPQTEQRPTRPTTRRRRFRLVPYLVLLLTVVGTLSVVFILMNQRARAGHGLPDYSVYSDDEDGLATAAAVLRQLGWRPVAVTRPIQQTHHRGLLILVEPKPTGLAALLGGEGISDTDVDALLDWVKNGNTLLYSAAKTSKLHKKLGVTIHDSSGPGEAVLQALPATAGGYTARVDSIGVEDAAYFTAPGALPLWTRAGKRGAVLVKHGQGRVLVLADPSVLTHRGLLREDNAIFLYNVAALDVEDGNVYFDEYHRGIRAGGGYWNYLRYHNQQWLVLQLVLVAGLTLWAVGRRLGPPAPMPVTRQADGVDYASSVARIYHKADLRPLVAQVLARHFLDVLTRSLRLPRSASPQTILMTWKSRYSPQSLRELQALLVGIERKDQSDDDLVRLARELDGFLDKLQTRKRK
jgi:hypothetical protein